MSQSPCEDTEMTFMGAPGTGPSTDEELAAQAEQTHQMPETRPAGCPEKEHIVEFLISFSFENLPVGRSRVKNINKAGGRRSYRG